MTEVTEVVQLWGIRRLILGKPLAEREGGEGGEGGEGCDDELSEQLRRHSVGLSSLILKTYGTTEAATSASLDVADLAKLPDNVECIVALRATLLMALYKEPEVQSYFGNDACAADLATRVLPLIVPAFLKDSCQRPDSFVALAAVLSEMWAGEVLGNWGRGGAGAGPGQGPGGGTGA